jgi:AcrR family transcriptional regulator
VQQGEETRRNILRLAVDVASKRGLDALTIGDLAKELGMSKSGLFGHFGSKEDLQIQTIEAAEMMFGESIIHPACQAGTGLVRLHWLLEGYVRYLEQSVFSGGCFFASAAAEFDDRPGRVRDRIAVSMHKWNDKIEGAARAGQDAGEIDSAVDAAQLAFELEAIAHHANFCGRLMGDERSFEKARHAIAARLWDASTARGRSILESVGMRGAYASNSAVIAG